MTTLRSNELAVQVHSNRFDDNDERWRTQADDLLTELHQNTDLRTEVSAPEPGSKGLVDAVIVGLGTAGAFQAVASCFRAWLTRDRTRSISVMWHVDGVERRVVLESKALDDEAFDHLLAQVRKSIGDGQWNTDDIAHS